MHLCRDSCRDEGGFSQFNSHRQRSPHGLERVLPLRAAEFGRARDWIAQLASPLRVLDAIHLAASSISNSARLLMTTASVRSKLRITCFRKEVFLRDDSRRKTFSELTAIFKGIPGNPAPEPISRTRQVSSLIYGNGAKESTAGRQMSDRFRLPVIR